MGEGVPSRPNSVETFHTSISGALYAKTRRCNTRIGDRHLNKTIYKMLARYGVPSQNAIPDATTPYSYEAQSSTRVFLCP